MAARTLVHGDGDREGHTGAAQVALAEATKDSDLALETRTSADQPLIEDAMRAAGFHLDPQARQPGAWLNDRGIPVDPMVPETLAGGSGRRGDPSCQPHRPWSQPRPRCRTPQVTKGNGRLI
jgi:hypothetical protein